MDMRNCPKCGKLFQHMSSPICPECEKDEENIFEEVREYVKENPDSTMAKVVANTRATPKKIMKYIRDGRLEISSGMQGEVELRCQSCGKPISKGKYCDACVIKINQDVKDMFTEKKPAAKMHISAAKRK